MKKYLGIYYALATVAMILSVPTFAAGPGSLGSLLQNGNLDGAYISPNTVTNSQLDLGSVTTDKIIDGSIGASNIDTTIQKRVGTACSGKQMLSVVADGTLQCIDQNVCMPSSVPDPASICSGSGVTYTVNVYCDSATVNGTKDCTTPPPPPPTCSDPTPCGTPATTTPQVCGCEQYGNATCTYYQAGVTCAGCEDINTSEYLGPYCTGGSTGGCYAQSCDGSCNQNVIDYNGSAPGCGVPPQNGSCGSDNGATLSSAPTNLCAYGTPSSVTGSGPWSWTCSGTSGGITVVCSANSAVVAAVDGVCGSANNSSFASAPTTNLCSVGTSQNFSGPVQGGWKWDCAGSNGGATAYCAAAPSYYYLTRSSTSTWELFNDHVVDGAYTVMNEKPVNWCAETDAHRGLYTATSAPSSSDTTWKTDKSTWSTNNGYMRPTVNVVYSHWNSVAKGTWTCQSWADAATFNWGTYTYVPEQTFVDCTGSLPTHSVAKSSALRQVGAWHYATSAESCAYSCSGNWKWNGSDCNTCGITSADCDAGDIFSASQCICKAPTSCFPAGTKVTLSDGTHKNIEDISIGDSIMIYDELLGTNLASPVVEAIKHPAHEQMIHHIVLEDGTVIEPNDEHPLYVANQKRYIGASFVVDMFSKGQDIELQKADGSLSRIASISSHKENIPTYNLHVLGISSEPSAGLAFGIGHNYYANDVLVHNMKAIN